MKSIQKITIAILLLTVFAVGTINTIDTVDAAKWKKYDSGTFKDEYPVVGYKKVGSYQSYTKGNNQLYVNIYAYSKKGNKKLDTKIALYKKNNIIKYSVKDYFSGEKATYYYETKWNVKTFYKYIMKDTINEFKTPIEKKYSDKKSFTVNNVSFKAYGFKKDKDLVYGFIYRNNDIFSHFSVQKENNNVIYKEYNQKRKLSAKESFKSTQSATSIYKTKRDIIINKLKS